MPTLNGQDFSTLPRGIKSTRAEYGQHGNWLGIPHAIWHDDIEHQVFVLPTEEKTHIMLVPRWCRDEVFRTMQSTWSWSKHLAERMVMHAVCGGTRPNIWHHGIVSVKVAQGMVKGITELHTEKPKQVKEKPWAPPEFVSKEDHGTVVVMDESRTEHETIRL